MKTKEIERLIANKIADHWYKEIHGQVAPIFGKQKLRDFAEAELKKLHIPHVMGSLVKSLNWIDSPKKRSGDIYKVMSRANVPMPHTVGNACIEITEKTYPYNYYEATLWCFNRGTYMADGKSVEETKLNAFKWWSDFVSGFLNCP